MKNEETYNVYVRKSKSQATSLSPVYIDPSGTEDGIEKARPTRISNTSDNASDSPSDSLSDSPSDNASDNPSDSPSDSPYDSPSDSPYDNPTGSLQQQHKEHKQQRYTSDEDSNAQDSKLSPHDSDDENDPSVLTSQNSTTRTTTTTKTTTETIDKKWSGYRLGDWVLGKGRTSMDHYRDSLAWEYIKALDRMCEDSCVLKQSNGALVRPKKYVRDAFCDLLEKPRNQLPDDMLPRDGDLVIHLRLGDVVNQFKNSTEINDAFEYGVSIVPSQIRNMLNPNSLGWWHYIKSKCYYKNMLSQLEAATAKTNKDVSLSSITNTTINNNKKSRVIIVGSAVHQKSGSTDNSIKYTKLVEQFFVGQGYEVTTRLDGLPDNDIVWMSHAPIFVAAGGGFSKLASDCVEYYGGIVFPESSSWSIGLDESCGKAPRPDIPMKTYSWEAPPALWRGKSPWTGVKNYPPEETKWE